jgi:anti-sigma B factor antagonist
MSESPLIAHETIQGRVTILRIKGRLDAETAPHLVERGQRVAAEGRDLVLNLSDVSFIGSSGVGALLSLFEDFEDQAGKVRFVELSPQVRTVLELLQLNEVLGIDENEAAGLKRLKGA